MPEITKARALSLIDKIDDDGDSSEGNKLEKWIDGLISIPFSKYVPMFKIDKTDTETDTSSVEFNRSYITNVHKCLNDAIYGHDEAKFHIIQHVAKWLKNPDSTGSVMAIQGPMGNGKTTLVKEGIAKALNRPFAFVSLGGASDSSYLNGHSQTYEGSIWGRIADILIKSKCMNPIIYFDELDKVSDTSKGEEIINLLTHITDFSQNDKYQDNYFSGIDLDLSKILFIFSFNDESKVNRILKDRMHVINTKGFKLAEKIKISYDYMLPKLYDSYKFNREEVVFSESNIEYIVSKYTEKEEGVRNLQRSLDTILSKINMYNMYFNPDKPEDTIVPFKIKDFKLPYNITNDTINTLLTSKKGNDPPDHMYL
jgi:ATP-dependent Lon protease